MITSIAFAKSIIDKIVKWVPNVRCRYEFHESSFTHFIEVVPNSVYRLNSEYILIEKTLMKEFENKFPGDSICFITDDSDYKITKPIYKVTGRNYSFFKGITYATVDYLLHLDQSMRGCLEGYENVATRHKSVIMAVNEPGCVIIPEPPPQKLDTEYENSEALYTTESFFCVI